MRIAIVGAGMAGMTAAAELRKAGYEVVVFEKGRGVGGRMASRRIEQATLDHGAQFMTARRSRFIEHLEQWRTKGLVKPWFSGSSPAHVRWRGDPSMTAVPKYLADGITLHLKTRVSKLRRMSDEWQIDLEIGDTIRADAVILTPPIPQSLTLMKEGNVDIAPSTLRQLENIRYERCLAVLALLDGPSHIPSPGGLSLDSGPIAWLADNHMKGISAIPAITIHATDNFSVANWEKDRQKSGQALIDAATAWLGAEVINFQVHGWRYSKPINGLEQPCIVVNESPLLLWAGDACGGARVEGAALSGWAAADSIKQILKKGTFHAS